MSGIKIIWYEKKGTWSCEVKKTCGPHVLKISEKLEKKNKKEPTAGECIRLENVLVERLKSMVIQALTEK